MFYSEDVIEQVRQANDILDVVSAYVTLKKKGRDYFGLCPFHNEKTPSFSVSQQKQMYYCFGCGAGGNSITFLMDYENITFPEALKLLADRAGITLPEQEQSADEKRQADFKVRLLDANREAARYYHYQLNGRNGAHARAYIEKRGLTQETVKRFGLGYSNTYGDELYRYLRSKGFDNSVIKETGLCRIEEKGPHDMFWNRVMFPIMDANSRVIGFGGRVMGEGEPKYLNSPETKIFDKSRNLYGLNYAKTWRKPYLLLCEGYMDVISMQQAGFTGAVASLGTAFTPGQASLLKRYTQSIILTYDSDEAGTRAALRAIPILKEAGLNARVLDLSPYKDPDEFIKARGAEEFEKRIDSALNCFLFETDAEKKKYDLTDPGQRTDFYNSLAEMLMSFPEKLERDNYVSAVAARYNIPRADFERLVNDRGAKTGFKPRQKPAQPAPVQVRAKKESNGGLKRSEELLVTWMSDDERICSEVSRILGPDDFSDELCARLVKIIQEDWHKGSLTPGEVLNRFINDDEEYRKAAKALNAPVGDIAESERSRAVTDAVRRVKNASIDRRWKASTDINERSALITERKNLQSLKISIE